MYLKYRLNSLQVLVSFLNFSYEVFLIYFGLILIIVSHILMNLRLIHHHVNLINFDPIFLQKGLTINFLFKND